MVILILSHVLVSTTKDNYIYSRKKFLNLLDKNIVEHLTYILINMNNEYTIYK